MIGGGRLLTNAHCVEYHTQVKVKRRGDDTKYVATVLAKGVECDIALLLVESEDFCKGTEPLRFGRLPCLQDAVTVVGYPLGGDTISVTKGVVSRIEVTSYAHGAADLLGIQIDAAINPGNSGGPAFNDNGECIGIAFQVYRSAEAENIGYVIPTTVVSHFLNDYDRNGKYTGFPCLGVLLQKLENPALRACLNVNLNEGEVEFRSVLHPMTKNIRLYVKRVFISDDFDGELFPRYLSFVKGVVNSNDLPLNVSRGILQENRIVRIMKKHLVRKTFDMIQGIMQSKEDYKKFWENFGKYIKLGCIEDPNNHKRIVSLLRFFSSMHDEEMISLNDYIEQINHDVND